MNPATEAGRVVICKALNILTLRSKAVDLIVKNKILCNANLELPTLDSVLNKTVLLTRFRWNGMGQGEKNWYQ